LQIEGSPSHDLTVLVPIAFLQLTNSTSAPEVFGAYPGFSMTTAAPRPFPLEPISPRSMTQPTFQRAG